MIHSGLDNFLGTPNGKVHRVLTKLALEHLGDVFQPFIYGQKAFPLQTAVKYKIPLVVYGENGEVEYGGAAKNEEAATHNVTSDMVRRAFQYRCKCAPEVARLLAASTTPFGCLPQGAPYSSIVAAVATDRLADRLRSLAEQHGARYTQYVDDITLSGPKHIARLKNLMIRIIRSVGFDIASEKIEIVPALAMGSSLRTRQSAGAKIGG